MFLKHRVPGWLRVAKPCRITGPDPTGPDPRRVPSPEPRVPAPGPPAGMGTPDLPEQLDLIPDSHSRQQFPVRGSDTTAQRGNPAVRGRDAPPRSDSAAAKRCLPLSVTTFGDIPRLVSPRPHRPCAETSHGHAGQAPGAGPRRGAELAQRLRQLRGLRQRLRGLGLLGLGVGLTHR